VLEETYSIYGLIVDTAQVKLPVPLISQECVSDVSIAIQGHCQPLQEAGNDLYYFSVSPHFSQFQYRGVALFTIKQGNEIIVAPLGDADHNLLVNTLIGTPFGILLLQRNHLVFHASAIEVDDKSVCFIGASGSGKSTTAASLISSGHRLISDDVVAFTMEASQEIVPLPGYPWMKVNRKDCLQLKLDEKRLSKLQASSPKKKYSLTEDRFSKKPPELACVYILSWGNELLIEPVKTKKAVFNLLAHAYGFVPSTANPEAEKKRFQQIMRFVKDTPCFALQRPKNTNTIIEVGQMIKKHMSSIKKC